MSDSGVVNADNYGIGLDPTAATADSSTRTFDVQHGDNDDQAEPDAERVGERALPGWLTEANSRRRSALADIEAERSRAYAATEAKASSRLASDGEFLRRASELLASAKDLAAERGPRELTELDRATARARSSPIDAGSWTVLDARAAFAEMERFHSTVLARTKTTTVNGVQQKTAVRWFSVASPGGIVLVVLTCVWPLLLPIIPLYIYRRRQNLQKFVAQGDAIERWGRTAIHSPVQERASAERSSIDSKATASIAEVERTWNDATERAKGIAADAVARSRAVAPEWSDPGWESWNPVSADLIAGTRVGWLRDGVRADLRLPFNAGPGGAGRSLVVFGGDRNLVGGGVDSLLARSFASFRPGRVRCTFIDPVGLGSSVAAFMVLAEAKFDAGLVGGRAWTEPRHIEQRLEELTETVETIIQQRLQRTYETIEEYNRDNPYAPEPYRFVVLFDVPMNVSADAFRRLVSLTRNGPRCGVYTVVVAADPSKPIPHDIDLGQLRNGADVVEWNGERFMVSSEPWDAFELVFEEAPPKKVVSRIVTQVGTAAVAASSVQVPYSTIAPPPFWDAPSDSSSEVAVPLGPAGTTGAQELKLRNDQIAHALIAGRTGSGKSTLLHAAITGLAYRYAPDEVELYLVDFKKGVEFRTYADHLLPHARVIAVAAEREFGLSVLQRLDAELALRAELFKQVPDCSDLRAYRAKTGRVMPRTVLIVDEFQEFFSEDDNLAATAGQLLDRLARQGRSFGIHIVLASQTLGTVQGLSRGTLGQFLVRIALMCTEADSRTILAEDNPAARTLSRPGEAIYNDANGLVDGNRKFQVAWLDDTERDRRLQAISDHARSDKVPVVFDGNLKADVERNLYLADVLAHGPASDIKGLQIWLGESLALDTNSAITLRREAGSNLTIIGSDLDSARTMLAIAARGLAAQLTNGGRVDIIDFGDPDADNAEFLNNLPGNQPNIRVHGRRELARLIGDLSDEITARQADDRGDPRRILILCAPHRARELRDDPDQFASSFSAFNEERPPTTTEQLRTILGAGPEQGVHTITWFDTVPNLTRTIDRRTLRDITHRAMYRLNPDDSHTLIDSSAAAHLPHQRLLTYNDSTGTSTKLRPYSTPSTIWWTTKTHKDP